MDENAINDYANMVASVALQLRGMAMTLSMLKSAKDVDVPALATALAEVSRALLGEQQATVGAADGAQPMGYAVTDDGEKVELSADDLAGGAQ